MREMRYNDYTKRKGIDNNDYRRTADGSCAYVTRA